MTLTMAASNLAVRWTIGDVSLRGYEALALSIRSIRALLPGAKYSVSVNSVPLEEAQRRLGPVATSVDWNVSDGKAPAWLQQYLHSNYAEGVAWKFAPVRLFADAFELSLDNDIVFWELPSAMKMWLADPESTLIAEDVTPAFGQFARLCGEQPRNSGIRGLPPRFDMEDALRRTLEEHPVTLKSELDEQGLQVAVVTARPHHVVRIEEVTICSPFPPHLPGLGRCGAHFVGLNAKKLPWEYEGRSGEKYIHEHWDRYKPELERRVQAAEASVTLV